MSSRCGFSWDSCRLRASGAYRCLAALLTRKIRAMLRGLPVIFDMNKTQSRCLYATYWEVGVLWCIATSKCPKVSVFLQVCCIWLLPTLDLQVMVMGDSSLGMEIPNFHPSVEQRGIAKKNALRQSTPRNVLFSQEISTMVIFPVYLIFDH